MQICALNLYSVIDSLAKFYIIEIAMLRRKHKACIISSNVMFTVIPVKQLPTCVSALPKMHKSADPHVIFYRLLNTNVLDYSTSNRKILFNQSVLCGKVHFVIGQLLWQSHIAVPQQPRPRGMRNRESDRTDRSLSLPQRPLHVACSLYLVLSY